MRENTLCERAEGIQRIAGNDECYECERKRQFEDKKPAEKQCEPGQSGGEKGLEGLIKGLHSKNFSPEDILIGAMIILMLNSNSEDDMLMVLVLLMLL